MVTFWKTQALESWYWTSRAKPAFFVSRNVTDHFPHPNLLFSLCVFSVLQWWGDEKQMQSAACSSSICEPRTPAPAASASIKPAKIDCCFSEMCWREAGRENPLLFSQGKAKSPGHCCIYVKTSKYSLSLRTFGLEPRWEHLAGSRGAFFVAREKLFCSESLHVPVTRRSFCGAVASRFLCRESSLPAVLWPGMDTESWLTAGFGFRNLKFRLLWAVDSWWLTISLLRNHVDSEYPFNQLPRKSGSL